MVNLTGCVKPGDISNVTIKYESSKIFNEEDMKAAVDVILDNFKNWNGCTLTDIWYAGDTESLNEKEYYSDTYVYDEVIVFYSNFNVDSSGGDGSLNPNDTYTSWDWILCRSDNGQWRILTYGYG
jgi:hypothetical protein